MSALGLTSNHVNYLVWRYLQESGFGDSAAKLQRDWQENPQELPFAPFINAHALISLVQKGLQYHEIEHSIDENGQQTQPNDSTLFFGPPGNDAPIPPKASLSKASPPRPDFARPPPADPSLKDVPASTKRDDEEAAPEIVGGDAMDVDPRPSSGTGTSTNGVPHDPSSRASSRGRSPPREPPREPPLPQPQPTRRDLQDVSSPQRPDVRLLLDTRDEGRTENLPEPVASPTKPALPPIATKLPTIGSSIGTQVEKILELGAEADTTYLNVVSKSVLHCAWSPTSPATLLVAGNEALSRIWNIIRGSGPQRESQFIDLQQAEDVDSRWLVTASSWSPDGEHVALALCDSSAVYDGNVFIWTRAGRLVNVFPIGQHPMLCLRWNMSSTTLLGLGASEDGSTLLLWDPMTADTLEALSIEDGLEDACWLDESNVIVAGGRTLQTYRFDGQFALSHSYSPAQFDDLWLVRYDSVAGMIATCTHGGRIYIYDRETLLYTIEAHSEPITALEWQPILNPRAFSESEPRLFASSSLDGTVKIWSGRQPWTCLHQLTLGRASLPAMTLSFSPDGFALAAASSEGKILVWNAKEGGAPLAAWSDNRASSHENGTAVRLKFEEEEDEDEEMTNGSNGLKQKDENGMSSDSGAYADQHSLSWDADGGKLAYGVGQKLAIIDFRR